MSEKFVTNVAMHNERKAELHICYSAYGWKFCPWCGEDLPRLPGMSLSEILSDIVGPKPKEKSPQSTQEPSEAKYPPEDEET
jgi:hypothetical protein